MKKGDAINFIGLEELRKVSELDYLKKAIPDKISNLRNNQKWVPTPPREPDSKKFNKLRNKRIMPRGLHTCVTLLAQSPTISSKSTYFDNC